MMDQIAATSAAVSDRRPRIAFTLHELGQGGTDRVCAHLARGFADAGFSVELIVLFGCAPTRDAMLGLVGPDVAVRVLDEGRGSRNVGRLLVLRRLIGGIRASAPDLVMSTGNNMNWITALAFRRARLPVAQLVLKMTNPIVRPKDGAIRRRYRHWRYQRAFDQASGVLTLCDRETALLRRDFPRSSPRIGSVTNPYVTPSMLALGTKPTRERDLILSIGRLVTQKRYDLLIRAFARVRTPDARLVILGEGPERRSLEALVRELGLGDRVALPGYVPCVEPWLSRARLFVLSSRYEGLPAVVLEAMAANCPVIATDCFLSAGEIVGKAEGCTVVPNPTAASLAGAIDTGWSRDRPADLVAIARRYTIERGVMSHLTMIKKLVRTSTAE